MKKMVFPIVVAMCFLSTMSLVATTKGLNPETLLIASANEKLDIKIKNDSNDEVTVLNAGSGGTYRLTKNATTTIKMEEGDKLFYYEGGKKGRLLLTASNDMNGKVQLYSKL